jgi:hypothetical protein
MVTNDTITILLNSGIADADIAALQEYEEWFWLDDNFINYGDAYIW